MKITHNKSTTRLYSIWKHMKQRCYNTNKDSYINYGARGITICQDWKDNFINFETWALSNGYSDNLTIDRKDVNGNYEPSNCRWVTSSVQQANTRRLVKHNKSGYRGVSWDKSSNKWEVSIGVNKKTIKIGYYTDIIQAAKAYDTYIKDNNLPHTSNNLLGIDERVDSNVGQLLIATNSSGYRGVSAPKRLVNSINPWTASIQHKGKKIWSGYFTTAEDAAIARDAYIKANGLLHLLNFPEGLI